MKWKEHIKLIANSKSSLPKSNTSHWSFSTSQVDLTHNDDYVVTIVNIINITTIAFTSM